MVSVAKKRTTPKELSSVTINKNTGNVLSMEEKDIEEDLLDQPITDDDEVLLDDPIEEEEKEEKESIKKYKKPEPVKEDILDSTREHVEEELDDLEEEEDFPEIEPEENPHIDDFTSTKGIGPVTSIQITDEDKFRVIVAQLQMENLELESKLIEQKHTAKVTELNRIISDYKVKYEVPDEWKLHLASGSFNKQK